MGAEVMMQQQHTHTATATANRPRLNPIPLFGPPVACCAFACSHSAGFIFFSFFSCVLLFFLFSVLSSSAGCVCEKNGPFFHVSLQFHISSASSSSSLFFLPS